MKHKGLGCGLLIVGFVVIVLFGASAYMLLYSLSPDDNPGRDYAREYKTLFTDYPETKPWVDSLQKAGALRDTFVISPDGDRHHGLIVAAARPTSKTVVLVHGYGDNALTMLSLGYLYSRELGYNLVLPELHNNGKSDGHAMQMGWNDRLDVLQWIGIADSMFRDSVGRAAIVVHGISMGAATTMCVAGEKTPASVRAFIEDCGYTSAWDEFAEQLDAQFGLPAFPLMYTTSALCKLKYGWSFGEASPLNQVRKCQKPMLFIHGMDDTYVPYRMLQVLYDAKPGTNKAIKAFPKATHARSYYTHKREYTELVKHWLRPYMGL
jgi:fermentation-respiration switch protein FrsA (DUF1100 family)